MRTWIIAVWDALRSSFWFVPAVLTVLSLGLGILLPVLDARIEDLSTPPLSWFETTSDASRTTLGAMASALITVTSVVFSVTMVTFSLTTSQFGSRLLRTFSENNISQLTLGVFLATSVYCLLVLRSVRTVEGEIFVPHLSTAFGVIASLASLVLLIVFFHQVAEAIQVQTVVRTVSHDLQYAIESIFPEVLGEGEGVDRPYGEDDPAERFTGTPAGLLRSRLEGYLQGVDTATLKSLALKQDCAFRLRAKPGDFLAEGLPLAEVLPLERFSEELEQALNDAMVVGSRRTPRQDVECAIRELVEVGVRALSPGINDPYTALTCIDYLSANLRRLARRKIPSGYHYSNDGRLLLSIPPTAFRDALDTAFLQLRQYGAAWPAVLVRLLEGLTIIAEGTCRAIDQQELLRHAEMIVRAAETHVREPNDVEDVRQAERRLRKLLGKECPPPVEEVSQE